MYMQNWERLKIRMVDNLLILNMVESGELSDTGAKTKLPTTKASVLLN